MKRALIIKITLVLSVLVMLFFAGCSKDDIIETNKQADLEAAGAEAISLKAANFSSRIDEAYEGYLRAFLKREGGQTFFSDGIDYPNRAFMWGQAYMITGIEDYYDRTRKPEAKALVADLLNTFLANETSDLSWDSWNDDVQWAIIALARGYFITGNTAFLDAAKSNFDMVWHRGWDDTYGGGIWENMDNVPDGGKGCLSNFPMAIAGIWIYEATGDQWYFDRARDCYDWAADRLMNRTTGRMYEDWGPNGLNLQSDDNYYNSGLLINAAAGIYKHNGDVWYYNDATLASEHVMERYPIMYINKPANGGFGADQVVRGISKFAVENGLEWKYSPWLVENCEAAWNTRRTDYNISNNDWLNGTPYTNQWGMECISALVIYSVTPEPINSGWTYTIIAKNSGKALDVAGASTENGANVLQWTNGYSSNQKWVVTDLGNNEWSIVSANSGKSLDVEGGSNDNGANILQWDWHGGNNQRWYIESSKDGFYYIKSVQYGKHIDIQDGSADNGANVLLWEYTGGDNQRFRFVY
jgi:hypothetical protein